MDFLIGCRRLEIEQRLDVAAHGWTFVVFDDKSATSRRAQQSIAMIQGAYSNCPMGSPLQGGAADQLYSK
jgi:hypothetical protein